MWAPSRFVAEALSRISPIPVHIVPYGIEAPVTLTVTRETLGLPADAFLVLCMFDLRSYTARKNPAAAINAFHEAFGRNHKNARLIIKVHNASGEDIEQLDQLLGGSRDVLLVNKDMDRREVNSLISCCDVLISLHRSEGFGLVMAEAMYLGVPVIATNWSANLDFMNSQNACLVDYTLIPTDGAYLYGQMDQRWAEPDIKQAAQYLCRLYEEPVYRQTIANAGRESIRQDFSIEHCAKVMQDRLTDILRYYSSTKPEYISKRSKHT